MPWPYAFVDLSESQKLQRRDLLDHYGRLAQFSALVPLLALQVYYLLSFLLRQRSRVRSLETPPSSPRVKKAAGAGGRAGSASSRQARVGRVRWWLNERVVLGGEVLGSRGEVGGAVGWAVWLAVLCFLQTGRDYLHLTKRFGIVAASQLPLHYLLALKSPYSPVQRLTGRSHEGLNTLHQFLGRIVTVLLCAHAALYVNFYVQSDLLAAKVREFYVVCGIVGVLAFTAVGTTALAPVRRWSYRVFYVTHVTLAGALLPVLFFHVSHIRVYLYETAAVYAANVLLRTLSSHTVQCSIKLADSGSLVEITIPLASHTAKALRKYQPGQHAYLSLPGHSASRTFRSNPFSLASIPAQDGELRFVARILDGNTARLARAAKLGGTQQITIEGPYGVPSHAEKLLEYDRVLFVAGGIGGTFIAPLYRHLLADLSPSPGSNRRQNVTFIWAARSMEDVKWAIPVEGKEREGFVERLEVWVTGAPVEERDLTDDFMPRSSRPDEGEAIEMQESKGLLSQGGGQLSEEAWATSLRTYRGRPPWKSLLSKAFSRRSSVKVAVVVCGPASMGGQLREVFRDYVGLGGDVWLWEESFAL